MFARWLPRPSRPLVRAAIGGLLDERLRAAVGIPSPKRVGRIVHLVMGLRARVLRVLPKRPRLRTTMVHRNHPRGWRLEDLGPPAERTTPSARSSLDPLAP
jgi:hypothetical protein